MDILKAAEGTCQGVRADVKTKGQVEDLVQRLEALNPTIDPAFSEGMDGRWIVKYSTAPPPSNGVLGPFVGLAYQEIDLQAGTYENILKVKKLLSQQIICIFLILHPPVWLRSPLCLLCPFHFLGCLTNLL